jgi:hypothetical protein
MLGFGRPLEVFTSMNLEEAYGGHLRLVETEEGMMLFEDTCCGEGLL